MIMLLGDDTAGCHDITLNDSEIQGWEVDDNTLLCHYDALMWLYSLWNLRILQVVIILPHDVIMRLYGMIIRG